MVVRFFCVIRVLVCARVSRVCVPPPPVSFHPVLTTIDSRKNTHAKTGRMNLDVGTVILRDGSRHCCEEPTSS